MQRELAALDLLLHATLRDQPLREFGAFPHRDHPAGDVAAEDIQDHVEVEVGPLGRSEQLGDVPAPELIGSRRQQFRLLVRRMRELIAAFAGFTLLFQEAIHGANRAVIPPFIEQRRIHSGWRAILKPFFVEMSQDGFAFRRTKGACWQGARDRKSTRLNSSHSQISYAVFCLKKKKMTGKQS